ATPPGALLGSLSLVSGVFAPATYPFRMLFMAFHGAPRFAASPPPHESPAVVTVPLLLLAVPSVVAGYYVGPVVFGDFFGPAVPPTKGEFHGIATYMAHGFAAAPFWLALAGIATAYVLYLKRTDLPKRVAKAFGPLYALV